MFLFPETSNFLNSLCFKEIFSFSKKKITMADRKFVKNVQKNVQKNITKYMNKGELDIIICPFYELVGI